MWSIQLILWNFQEAEQNHALELDKSEQEKVEITQKLDEMLQQEASLSAKVKTCTPCSISLKCSLLSLYWNFCLLT